MSDLRKLVGKRLKQARLDNHLTQQQLSNQLYFARSYIALLETGRTPVEINKLGEFARVLNKPIIYFLSDFSE